MKVVKWSAVFVLGFTVSWILIFTFTQDPFKELAPAKILWHSTTEIPIYAFVAITFGVGLLIGFFAAAYYYIAGQAGIRNKKKVIREMEREIGENTEQVKRLVETVSAREKEIQRLEDAAAAKNKELYQLRAAVRQEKGAKETKGRKTGTMKSVGEKDLFS